MVTVAEIFSTTIVLISLQYGLLYVLMSLGLTLTYYIARFANFAQGEYVMISAYVIALLYNTTGVPYLALLPLAGLVGSATALASYFGFFRIMMKRGLSSNMLMIGSIGVMLIFEYIIWIFTDVYGILYRPVFDPKRLPVSVGMDTLWIIVVATILSVISLVYIYYRTSIGRFSRAYADNPHLARVSGISELRVMIALWSITGFLAGLGGGLWGAYVSQVTPNMGFENLLRIFATTILGGMTSFYGTIAAGLIVGFAENYGIYLLNQLFGVPTVYKPVIPFVIIIATLLIYPEGLGGLSMRRLALVLSIVSRR